MCTLWSSGDHYLLRSPLNPQLSTLNSLSSLHPSSIPWQKSPAYTDSDIGIAYFNKEGQLCLWLIEHKLTEKEFTECGGSKSKGSKKHHDCSRFFAPILKDKNCCYYHDVRGFNYWNITESNQSFFPNHPTHKQCPFQGGMNQLWRNQLLGLSIEQDARQPFEQVYFSVVRYPANTALDEPIR